MLALGVFGCGVVLPADASDLRLGADPFVSQDFAQLAAVASGGADQRERAEALVPQFSCRPERADWQVTDTLGAHNEQRLAVWSDNHEGLFEARIKTGQPVQVGKVLPVPVNQEMGKPFAGHGGAGGLQARLVFSQRRHWRRCCLPELRPLDFYQFVFFHHVCLAN